MYDKYFTAQNFTVGTKIPKHKGILLAGATAGGTKCSFHFINNSGNTFSTTIDINQSPYILPIQIYTMPSMAAGMTAYYLN